MRGLSKAGTISGICCAQKKKAEWEVEAEIRIFCFHYNCLDMKTRNWRENFQYDLKSKGQRQQEEKDRRKSNLNLEFEDWGLEECTTYIEQHGFELHVPFICGFFSISMLKNILEICHNFLKVTDKPQPRNVEKVRKIKYIMNV